jgi:hypothetical protein
MEAVKNPVWKGGVLYSTHFLILCILIRVASVVEFLRRHGGGEGGIE